MVTCPGWNLPAAVLIAKSGILLQRTAACKFHPEHVVILQLTPALLLSSRTRGMRRGFYAHRIFYTARPRNRVSSSIGIGLEYL